MFKFRSSRLKINDCFVFYFLFLLIRMKNVHRVLVSSDGPDNNVIKLKPPMVFNMENANEFLSAFRECLTMLDSTEISPENLKAGNPHSFLSGISSESKMHVDSHGTAVKSL